MAATDEKTADAVDTRVGPCVPVFLKKYGVIHLRGALSDLGQRDLWDLAKPCVHDPLGRAAGFSVFEVSKKGGKSKRVPAFDNYGALLFGVCADRLTQIISADVCAKEPSYQRLQDLASGARTLQLDEVRGLYYRQDASLLNHVDSDDILFTMSVALGDDCEFVIGQKTGRMSRLSERSGKPRSIRMKSGDAIFFDGGSVPHQVKRIIAGTAPKWWEKNKIPNGSRCVLLFREKEESFYKCLTRKKK